ncbi:peptidoglycan DD-metalloendopeptidase family protein [Glaciecola petra]|uniref:Peptidoglycan DD-metalloendopeptidase family protein n=1 Tax=Glaciecola petra TaxID=3075602 RepID=A0ABU2ZPA7_9ALTE|nr:peptidoglycan DD-metalloendopeptidase family protein [Aestuariibacter sp. P117]MDT0593287.1 peptidoglycan DD-metalloendopeptidase family protein [Aestuariibacter sp. P117]
MEIKSLLLFVSTLLLLAACSSQHNPAPVISLSTKVATPQNLTVIEGNEYIVQKGDTLFAIAFYSGNDYQYLSKINNIPAPYIITKGQLIRLKADVNNQDINKNIAPEQGERKLSKIQVDHTKQQAYGVNKKEIHRKNQDKKQIASNNTDIKAKAIKDWIWPAIGTHTIATVGDDGSKRGLDIKGRLGTEIKASAKGKVVYAGNALKGYGNLIIIKHNDEYLSAYAHNEAILVREQMYVKQGQKIATMGSSGASDVMLHFEIRKKGKSVDPFRYLPKQ